jgi:hypothetical protein
MADPQSIYKDLQTALQQFEGFLKTNVPLIKPAVKPIDAALSGRLTELLTKLIDLLNKIKDEIAKINVGVIPGLAQVTQFSTAVKTLLETSKNLLPSEAGTINDVLGAVNVVGGLPALGTSIKDDINKLINDIIGELNNLKS